ncbi:MAG: response regulator transcription factor [Christensenellaceae bacterium]|jgi:two-component system alkaline phosphatase synthesis response regulator PhoP
MAKILIVEDEKPINELIKRNLRLVGHECEQAFDGITAVEMAQNANFDLVILDIMLPGLSGFEVIGDLNGMPVIFLTAKDGVEDRVKGLDLGADDYIVKPFDALELIARVNAVLRRTSKSTPTFELDDARVDFEGRIVYYKNEPIELTPKEFELLEELIVNRNIALSRDKLLENVWGYDFLGDTRTIDVHIQKLRKKLGWEDRIKTVYKLGYRLETDS